MKSGVKIYPTYGDAETKFVLATQDDIGKSPLRAGFRVTWELRKRRVNQQPELSLVRFTADKTWFSAWWGPRAFLPSASGRAALRRSPDAGAPHGARSRQLCWR